MQSNTLTFRKFLNTSWCSAQDPQIIPRTSPVDILRVVPCIAALRGLPPWGLVWSSVAAALPLLPGAALPMLPAAIQCSVRVLGRYWARWQDSAIDGEPRRPPWPATAC